MKHWKIICGITGVFLLGMIAGALLTIGVVRRTVARGPEGWKDAIVRRLSWELKLDREQREQLRVIVADAQQEIRTVQKEVQPQVREVLDKSADRVRTMLRPGQRERFDEIVAKQRAKWEQ
jgi:uncharacterized membrane protein